MATPNRIASLPLSPNRRGDISLPQPMTEAEWKQMMKLLRLYKKVFVYGEDPTTQVQS